MRLDVMKTIERYKEKDRINPHYSFYDTDVNTIIENSESTFDIILNIFIFGYAQGFKACKTEIKKKNTEVTANA